LLSLKKISSIGYERQIKLCTSAFYRACKGFHQSAASAKLNPELRLFIEPEKDSINRLQAPN
jgi:hypothetical protein